MTIESSEVPVQIASDTGGWPLLRGRLKPPVTRSVLVPRSRIDALLDQSLDFEVTLVSAPAGFGKTTAVSQWFRGKQDDGLTVAWVSLDEMDSEPTRILMYLVASIAQGSPAMAEALNGLFGQGFESSTRAALSTLYNAVEEYGQDVVLVVDDLHASLEEESRAIFSALANHGLPNLHVLLILRDPVDIPLARTRMRRALLELGPLDLQFSAEETDAYFSAHSDLGIDAADLKTLHQRTDGWIAALQLAVLSLRGHEDPKGFIARFSGQHRDISDLLAEEVLARLNPETVNFLEQSAVLTSFSADLCDELFERTGSREMIQRLEAGNFFIFNMDEEREFYRYHRLFGEYLRKNLEKRSPGRSFEIHRGAAEWFRDHQLPVRACLHAARSEDMDFLGETLAAVAAQLRTLGYGGTVMRYAAMLPPDVANRHPAMQLDRIYALTLSWRFDEAKQVLEQVRRSLTRDEGAGDLLYPELVHREGQLALLSDHHDDAERLCAEWLQLDQQRSGFDEGVVRTSLVWSRVERYEFEGLEQSPDIRQAFVSDDMDWAKVWNDSIFGSCYFARGDIEQAESLYRRGLSVAVKLGGRMSATPAMPALHLAELLYEKNELTEARQLVEDYLGLVTKMGMLGHLAAGYVTKARLQKLDGEPEAALVTLEEGCAVAERRSFARLHHILMFERYQLLLEQGNVDRCFRIARADGLMSALDDLKNPARANSMTEPQALSWAAIGLAKNRATEAWELLEHWRKLLLARGALRPAARFSVWSMRAAVLRGDRPRAARLLRESLSLSRDHGFVRTFVDGGAPVLDLLQNSDISDDKLRKVRDSLLLEAGVFPADKQSDTTHDAPVEALNARETEILRLVEQGLMNKQIAADLGITVGTVKWYMQQIFQKLAVRRRAQAIHKAKHLGFLK